MPIKQIIRRVGLDTTGHILWECRLADGSLMNLTMGEVVTFNHP